MSTEGGSQFIEGKYSKTSKQFSDSPEVEVAARRTKIRTGTEVPNNPDARIQNYINRFAEIRDREKPEDRQHGIKAIKRLLHSRFVIKTEDIPDSYWEAQIQQSPEAGAGEMKKRTRDWGQKCF